MSSFNATKYNFSGKVALITGSSSGIGEAIAIQLARYGASVTITGRNAENLSKVSCKIQKLSLSQSKPLELVGDLRDEGFNKQLIEQTVLTFGRLDLLVNNAGVTTAWGTLGSAKLMEEFDQIFRTNLRSVVQLTQLAVPHLEKVKGVVLNISSLAGIIPFGLVYSASKAALDMVTKTLALELGPKGIRVNSINPGFVETSILRSRGMDQPTIDGFYASIASKSLLGRIGTSDDIANLATFLLSDDARNITGSIYVSDSGFLVAPVQLNQTNLEKSK